MQSQGRLELRGKSGRKKLQKGVNRMKRKKLIYDWNKIPVVLDPQLAGVLLGLHPDTVARMIKAGEIKGFRVGKQWRINRRDIMELCGEHVDEKQGESL